MLGRRSDLPLDGDPASRFLPWLVAFMVYLAGLAVAGTLLIDGQVSRWQAGAKRTLTVQLRPTGDETRDTKEQLRALEILRNAPGVHRAEPVSGEAVLALLEPWLGNSGTVDDLPLPLLIDVELAVDTKVNVDDLTAQIQAVVGGVSIDDHSVWLDQLIKLSHAVQVLAAAVLGFILIAVVGSVIFATRTSLALHKRVIEVLHTVGAHDSYIAGQFAHHALVLGLKGGFFGFLLVVPTLLGIGTLAARLDANMVSGLTLSPVHWGILAALPVIAAVIAMASARVTVQRTLKRLI